MLTDRDYRRRMIQTVLTVAGVAILLAVLWVAREAVMLLYVSALIAMGFSPLVKLIERPSRRDGHRRVPRWLAILVIYAAIVAVVVLIGLMVIPPLVAQAELLWARLPEEFNKLQTFLINHKLMTHRVTLEEAVQSAPSGSGNAVGTVLIAISSLIGGVFGLVTILILTFYLLIEAGSMFEYLMRFVPTARRGDVAGAARQAVTKVSAWLRAQFVLAGVMGTFAAVGLGLMGVP
jgi:predicted PurR-regulated permease PerM